MPIFYDVYITSKYSFLCRFSINVLSTVFYESFYDFFHNLKFDIFPPSKTSKFKSRKNRGKSPFSPISFYSTYYFGKRHDMIQCTTFKNMFLKNACYLGHSTVHNTNKLNWKIYSCSYKSNKENRGS